MSDAALRQLGLALAVTWMVVGSGILVAWLRGRVRGGPTPWTALDGALGVAVMAWVSTWASIAAVRYSAGHWLPAGEEDLPLLPVVLATALGGGAGVAFAVVRAGLAPLGYRRAATRWLVAGVGLVGPMVVVSVLWVAMLEGLGIHFEEQVLLSRIRDDWGAADAWLVVGYGVLGAPLLEETLFRGFLLSPVARRAGVWPGIFLVSLLFGLLHSGDPQAVPPLVALGVVLGWLRLRSGSLWPGLLLHAGNNALAIFALAFQSG